MDASDSYNKFRAEVQRRAALLKKPLEVSQSALWAKSIVVEAMAGKHAGHELVGSGESFGFSEQLVNQCIEFALRRTLDVTAREPAVREAYHAGYEAARREFAKATGLYTEDFQ